MSDEMKKRPPFYQALTPDEMKAHIVAKAADLQAKTANKEASVELLLGVINMFDTFEAAHAEVLAALGPEPKKKAAHDAEVALDPVLGTHVPQPSRGAEAKAASAKSGAADAAPIAPQSAATTTSNVDDAPKASGTNGDEDN